MKKETPIPLSCSFCGKSQHEVRKLIAGPTDYICEECIKLCNEILAEDAKPREPVPASSMANAKGPLTESFDDQACSFCGGVGSKLGMQPGLGDRLIAGPSVFICDWCAGLCSDIIAEEIAPED